MARLARLARPTPSTALLLGAVGGLLLASSAPLWRGAARGTWRLTLPAVPHDGHPLVAGALFLLAGGALVAGWWALVAVLHAGRPADHRHRMALVVGALLVWWLPVLLGPPLLSNDVYSYVAQGTLAARGVDPTAVGPVALGYDPAFFQVDPVWAAAPAPYGPVGVGLTRLGVAAAGQDPAASVWAMRALVAAAVAIAAVGVARLARVLGRDPAVAVALAVANPLVTVHLVGGIHNDAWMLALLVWGCVFLRQGRRTLGIVLVAAALGVKLTAVAGLVAAGWWLRPSPAPLFRRMIDAAAVLAGGVALVVAAGAASGVGMGWLANLRTTGTVLSTFAPVTLAALVLGWVVATHPERFVAPLRLAGLGAAGVLAWRVLLGARRHGVEVATGLVLLAGTLLGPVVWPWYLPVAVALLAVAGPLRLLPGGMVLVSATLLTVWPTTADAGVRMHGPLVPGLQLAAMAAVVGLAVVVQRRAPRWMPHLTGADAAGARRSGVEAEAEAVEGAQPGVALAAPVVGPVE